MPAYLIARVNVTDPAKYENYKALAPAAIAQYGGKYLARGGATETLEGDAESRRVVILEFPDMEAARTFYNSPESPPRLNAPEYTAALFLFLAAQATERAGARRRTGRFHHRRRALTPPPWQGKQATRGEEQRSCDRETKEQQEARSSEAATGRQKNNKRRGAAQLRPGAERASASP
jgi:uncharacterized protein (DUF1330 family)